ncbi:MAG TPA: GAF domain-containing protein [Chloroflexota bacterium]|nr:GAF domain-containing protein [Chloroflexota bacterium]
MNGVALVPGHDQRAQALQAVYEISRAATRVLDLGRIAEATTEQLRELFDVDTAAIWLWNGPSGWLERLYTAHTDRKRTVRNRLRPGESLAGRAFAERMPQITEDYVTYPYGLPEVAASGIRSAMAMPMLVDGHPVGALVVGCVSPRRFSAEERQVLAFLAEQLAPVAEAAQLRFQLRRRQAQADALADLARRCVESNDVDELLSLLARHAATLLGADHGAVALVDERDRLQRRGAYGVLGSTWRRHRPLRSAGLSREVLDSGRTVIRHLPPDGVPVRTSRGRFRSHIIEGAASAIATALPSREGLRGVLHASWREHFEPGAEEVRLIETLAAFGATIIDHARRRETSEELRQQLQAIIDQMPSGVAVVDGRGKLSIVNQAGRDMVGAPEVMAEGIPIQSPKLHQTMRANGVQFDQTALARALQGERVEQYEYETTLADGRSIWLRASAKPLLDSGGKLAGAISVFSDVTQTKHEEQQRQRETDRRLALAAISEAMSSASRDVPAMLDIASREASRVLNATCTVWLLDEDAIEIVPGAIYDPDAGLQELLASLVKQRRVPLRESRHHQVVESGRPARWFDPTGADLGRGSRAPLRRYLDRSPVYAILVAPLRAHGRVLGTIGLYRHSEPLPFGEDDELFACEIGDRAGLGLENARLFEDLAAHQKRLEELSRRLVDLQEYERRAIALELHDEVGQGLTAARLLLQAARREPDRKVREGRLDEACATLDESISQVRGLSLDLRPPMLERFGLAPALEGYFERYTARTGIQVEFAHAGLKARPSPGLAMAMYRIVQEALTNVARHAHTDRVEVGIWSTDRQVWVHVADEGAGFDPALLDEEPSTGLTGMQERAELLGGELTIDSAPGSGTRLLARLPLQ